MEQSPGASADLREPAAVAPESSGPGTLVVGEERAAGARSARTRAAYAADWEHFGRWCTLADRAALPATASTVRLYLTDLEAAVTETGAPVYQPATLARRLAAIAAAHRDAGQPSPTKDPAVGAVLTGIRGARAAPPHRMRPLLPDDVRSLLQQMEWATWPGGLSAARDGFVVLAGSAGALRRSELAGLTIGDLRWHAPDGLHVRIRASKTDQENTDATIVLGYGTHPGMCPPCAGLRWLRLLDAARAGKRPLMRAVLDTPPWSDHDHLYPHPEHAEGTVAVGQDRLECRALAPDLPAGMPVLRGIRRGGHLIDTAVTGDALHAMIQRRAAAAGLAGPVGFHSLRAGSATPTRRAGVDHRAVPRHTPDARVGPDDHDRDHIPRPAPRAPSSHDQQQPRAAPGPDQPAAPARDCEPSPQLRAAAGPGYRREWALFCDYTAATDQPSLPTTVAALSGFLAAVPAQPATIARRVRAIAAAHRHAGLLLARPETGPAAPPPRRGRPGPEPGLMIAGCPTRGWPTGLWGRRDAFLIVLTEVLGYTHPQARALRPDDLALPTGADATVLLAGQPVPTSEDPRSCPACAVVRWLEILGLADGLGRGSARMALTAAHAPAATSGHQHRLEGPARWRGAAVLLPAIDRHGWHDDYRPVTTRSIRSRLALAGERAGVELPASKPDASGADTAASVAPAAADRGRSELELGQVLTMLDELADDADALNARIQALLADDTR